MFHAGLTPYITAFAWGLVTCLFIIGDPCSTHHVVTSRGACLGPAAAAHLLLRMLLHIAHKQSPSGRAKQGLVLQADISKEDHKLALVAALLLPLRAVKTADKKGKATSVVPFIIGDSIKWKKAHATDVAELQRQAPQLLQAYQSLQVHAGPS